MNERPPHRRIPATSPRRPSPGHRTLRLSEVCLIVALVGLVPLTSACAVPLKAKAPVERPALEVPPPPPRVVEPASVPDTPPDPVPDLPPAPAPARPSRPAPTRTTASNPPPEAKQEAKPETPPASETAAQTTTPPPPAQVPQLRTPQTADASEAEKNVRSTLERAKSALNNVNFTPLSNERKKAYNDAKAFIQQAEEAIKQGNYVFAQGVATKAETLAHELAGR
jgi:outer membrane biosynthesis protein TonB